MAGGAAACFWLLLAAVATGGASAAYSCPSSCVGACVCASGKPPGGLANAKTPQLITLTHDDALTGLTLSNIEAVLTNTSSNPNGCSIPWTLFTIVSGTSRPLVKQMYDQNHEIATHTATHVSLTPGYANITGEIVGARKWLAGCGIPETEIRGFRSPFLVHNPAVRAALSANNFTYDSSIVEYWKTDSSPSSDARLWPYSMDYGIPQACDWTAPSGNCTATERWPGLFEVPLQAMENATGNALYSMDPDAVSAAQLLSLLMQNFRYSYDGNRAPMGVYVHTPWLQSTAHQNALRSFIQAVQALPDRDVWFVTMSQVVDYMKAPVLSTQMSATMTCRTRDVTSAAAPACRVYTVVAGDSLFSISTQQGVAVADLVAANPSALGNASATLAPGMRLKLPPWNASCTASSTVTPDQCVSHTVAAGEYLDEIALNSGVALADLLAANPSVSATKALTAGQVLRIPPWPIECTLGNFSQPAPSPSPSPAAASPVPAPVAAPSAALQTLSIKLSVTGVDKATFDASYASRLAQSVAVLAGLPASQGAVTSTSTVSATQRRLLEAQGDLDTRRRSLLAVEQVVEVQLSLSTASSDATLAALNQAQQTGMLAAVLSALGLTLVPGSLHTVSGAASAPAAAPVAASPLPTVGQSPAATSHAPAPAPVAASGAPAGEGGSSSHLGAILGGAIGGGVGAILLAAVVVVVLRRRTASAAVASSSESLRSTFNPAFALPGATARLSVRTGAGAPKDARAEQELDGVVVRTATPSSARARAVSGTPAVPF